MTTTSPDISIVFPVYNERENLRPLLEQISTSMKNAGYSFEMIAVDDGSTDGSTSLLKKELSQEFPQLKAIFFKRNAGQTAAFDAGFRHVSGKYVVTMDADLQNDPADIPAMIKKMEDENFDLISGWRKNRKDGFVLRKIPSWLANRLIRNVTGTQIHDLGCSLKVYRREITDNLRLYGEMHRFISPLAEAVGARIGEYVVNHRSRHAGESKYGLGRTVKVLLDLVTVWFMKSYQSKPIYIFGGAGIGMIGLGFFISLFVLYEKIGGVWVHKNPLFLIAITLFLMGFQFLGLGLLSEMLARTYFESQDKKAYVISEKLGFPEA